jgi:hypothetical protein
VHRTRLPPCATPHMHCALRSRSSHALRGWPKTLRGWPRHGHDLPGSMNTVATRALHDPSLLTHSVKNLHHVFAERDDAGERWRYLPTSWLTGPFTGNGVVGTVVYFCDPPDPTKPEATQSRGGLCWKGNSTDKAECVLLFVCCTPLHHCTALHNNECSLVAAAARPSERFTPTCTHLDVGRFRAETPARARGGGCARCTATCALCHVHIASHWSLMCTDAPNTLTVITNVFLTQCCPVRTIARRLD